VGAGPNRDIPVSTRLSSQILKIRNQPNAIDAESLEPNWRAFAKSVIASNGFAAVAEAASRCATRPRKVARPKKDAAGLLPSRPNTRNSLVQALRAPCCQA
jgi:hypothetical protein